MIVNLGVLIKVECNAGKNKWVLKELGCHVNGREAR